MYEVRIRIENEEIKTTINDIKELGDLLLKYQYTSVDVKKRVKKLVKE